MKTKSIILILFMFLLTESFAQEMPEHVNLQNEEMKKKQAINDYSKSIESCCLEQEKNITLLRQQTEAILKLNEKIKELEQRIKTLEEKELKSNPSKDKPKNTSK